MRPRRSLAVQLTLLVSACLHGAGLWSLLQLKVGTAASPLPSLEVYDVPETVLMGMDHIPFETEAAPPQNTLAQLTPEQLKALPKDAEKLPDPPPSPDAVAELKGQLVELPIPDRPQQAPEQADYLAAASQRAEQEQAARQFKINPEVVASTFSSQSSLPGAEPGDAKARMAGEQNGSPGGTTTPRTLLPLLGRAAPAPAAPAPAPAPSTERSALSAAQARASRDATAPPRASTASGVTALDSEWGDGSRAFPSGPTESKPRDPSPRPKALESPSTLARLEKGLRPSLALPELTAQPEAQLASLPRTADRSGAGGGDGGTASITFRQGDLKGSPGNDRLNEKKGDATLLNAREFKYFSYMQRIRRQVNFYWSQALENIGSVQERLTRDEYTTVLDVTLDAKGNLKTLSLVKGCGVRKFDEATLQAFRLAAPFPPPPEGLLNSSGEARLPDFAFTVNLGEPPSRYSGIDPRSNVVFPGIVRP